MTCGNCKWWIEFIEVCTNGESEHRANFMCENIPACEVWEKGAR